MVRVRVGKCTIYVKKFLIEHILEAVRMTHRFSSMKVFIVECVLLLQ